MTVHHLARDEALALDRGSVREKDVDGHLHVNLANISKAGINPYVGEEIPGWEELGLDPQKIYKLLRDPDELRKGARTFRGKPLLIVHPKRLTADDHPYQKVVGSVGTDVEFNDPHLQVELTVWAGEAIDLIESEKKKQLSCGYRYVPDMTPGTWKGEAYDGRMTEIVGNHVALVERGRAGPDVVIGDSALEENSDMTKKPLSRKAAAVQGALTAFLAPKLAKDQAIDLTVGLRGITAKNFEEKRPVLAEYVKEKSKGKLIEGAEDGMAEGLEALLTVLTKVNPEEEGAGGPPMEKGKDDFAPGGGDPNADPDAGAEGAEGGAVTVESIKEFLRGELSPEAFAKLEHMLASLEDDDSGEKYTVGEGEGESSEGGAEDDPPPFKGKPQVGGGKDRMNKGAMDETTVRKVVTTAVDSAVAAERAAQKALRDAEREVRAYVGDVVGCDTAEQVYRKALGMSGMKAADLDQVKEVPALKILLGTLRTKDARGREKIAQDAAHVAKGADVADFHKRYPDAARITVI